MEGRRTKQPALSREDYAALAAFRKALRKFVRLTEERARDAGLSPQQHQVLLAIRARTDRDWASVGEIADSLQLKHHATVGLVDRCQTAGLVERAADPDDRRVVRVVLTSKGQNQLDTITSENLVGLQTLLRITKDMEALGEVRS